MADINLDDIDATIDLCPEDDDLLNYFLSGSGGAGGLLDELSIEASAAAALDVGIPTHNTNPVTDFGYNRPPVSKTSYSQSHASVETASTSSSADYDGPEADNELDTDEEKRRKRLERNRISARDSRARKKQYLELLKKKVAQLTADIASARGQHLDSADSTLSTQKANLINSLYDKIATYPLDSPLPHDLEEELRSSVNLLLHRYGPNSDERRAVVNYHFQQLDSLLLPPYTRFLLWMSIQEESFYTKTAPPASSSKKSEERKDSVAKKDGLWSALSTEMGMTYEQEEKIKSHYRASDSKTAKMERRKIAMAVSYLNQLKQNLAERSQAVLAHAETIQTILTPEQMVRYQHWVLHNRDKYRSILQEKTLQFANASIVDPEAKISTILRKPDQDLTVEDVTALLATLSKQHVTQQQTLRV
ncbi:hypothetical protein AC1031_019668 [Aphanomyces cochlioides]|nr:hypothetical protein AC1031_019668 [Aphanomyces cochlioides]